MKVGTEWVPRILSTERCAICVFNEPDVLQKVYRTDGVQEPQRECQQYDADSPHRRVLAAGEPAFDDFDALPPDASPLLQELNTAGFRSGVIAPMRSVGRTIGTISLCSSEQRFYGGTDAAKLLVIGKLLASQAQLMQAARESVRLAETDRLTGLANRTRLMHVLKGPDILNQPDSSGRVIGVLHIDLDDFKEVNDTLGHAAGDHVLKAASRSMVDVVGKKDLVARIGGDEFVIVSRSDRGGGELTELAERVLESVNQPVRIGDLEARVSASIGSALAGEPGTTADNLISNADMALYQVKRNGRGAVRAFNADMREVEERRRKLLVDISAAADKQAFIPFFQPQVSLATGHFSGFEMLARWVHPELGRIDPAEFIRIAVHAGVSEQIDTVVRRSGLSSLRKLRDAGWHAPRMSFNASARTVGKPDLVDTLFTELTALDLHPEDLVLEVLESDLQTLGPGVAKEAIDRLADAGFAVHLDDFGAGVGSIVNLANLSIKGIKLDGSLTAQTNTEAGRAIVSSTVDLANRLGLTTVAEGVETPRQFAMLRRAKCDAAQGYGISEPLPYDGLIEFMRGYGQAPIKLALTDRMVGQ